MTREKNSRDYFFFKLMSSCGDEEPLQIADILEWSGLEVVLVASKYSPQVTHLGAARIVNRVTHSNGRREDSFLSSNHVSVVWMLLVVFLHGSDVWPYTIKVESEVAIYYDDGRCFVLRCNVLNQSASS